jgi:hypothetical protein
MIRPWRLMMAPNMRLGNGNEGRGLVYPSKTITQEPATRARSLIASDNSRTVGPRFGHRETTERPSESVILLRRELTHMLHGSAPGHLQHHHLSSDTPEGRPGRRERAVKNLHRTGFVRANPSEGGERTGRTRRMKQPISLAPRAPQGCVASAPACQAGALVPPEASDGRTVFRVQEYGR